MEPQDVYYSKAEYVETVSKRNPNVEFDNDKKEYT